MIQTTAVVVGAGHAGLAMSHRLTERSIDHVVLERGEVANSWRTQRWPSLRLLTPNWQTRLPSHDYADDHPDGFMPVADVVDTLTRYARLIGAPVRTATAVHTVRAAPEGYEILANGDVLHARAVVLATGACNLPGIPGIADAIPPSITTLTPLTYRDPGQLPDGGVLVVGASATGVQLAGEIHRSGRPVTLAAGEHVRLPAPTAAATSSGGCRQRACWPNATTRSTTSPGPATSPPRSSPAPPKPRSPISTRSRHWESVSWAALAASPTAWPSSPALFPTPARSPT